MTLPSVTIETYLVFTAVSINLTPTITFTNGATAGSEVVTVNEQAITIQIQNGVTTMAQVVAAVATQTSTSGYSASQLVTVSAGSHGSTAVTANGMIAFAGGTPAVKASLTIGGVVLTAVTAGTAGNSITLQYTTGATAGSEVVTVVSNAISVQIADAAVANPSGLGGYGTLSSNAEQVVAAINASMAASALVVATALNTSPVFAAPAASPVNLTGGLAAAAATTGAVNGVTVVANATGSAANGLTITYTTGATAGSEVVTLDAFNNVTVQIQSGTSTVTQIVTAMNGSTPFAALYTASGSGSTTPFAINAVPLTGAVPAINPSLGFYADASSVTLSTTYQYLPFNNVMQCVTIENTEASGSDVLSFSWDGINVHGLLAATETVQFQEANKNGIYVKYVTGSPTFQIFATAR
jgi:hypothetical protein